MAFSYIAVAVVLCIRSLVRELNYRFLHSIFWTLIDPGLQRSGTLLHWFVVVVLPMLEDLFKNYDGDADDNVDILEKLSFAFTANGKNKTFAVCLLSSLYSRIKRFVFVVNSKRHFSIFV